MDARTLPGTTIECEISFGIADKIISPIFLGGGLVLSQVSQLTGLESYIVQNWIKRKYLVPPENKKYSKNQFARLVILNVLKDSFTFDQIVKLIGYVNGALDDHSDDTVNDFDLYSYFLNTLALINTGAGTDLTKMDSSIKTSIHNYVGKYEYSKERLIQVLKIMVTSYESLLIKSQAIDLFSMLDSE